MIPTPSPSATARASAGEVTFFQPLRRVEPRLPPGEIPPLSGPFAPGRIVNPRRHAEEIDAGPPVDLPYVRSERCIGFEPPDLAVPDRFPAFVLPFPVGDHLTDRGVEPLLVAVGLDHLCPRRRGRVIENRLLVGHIPDNRTDGLRL